ncbi:EF-hand domain and EF-hand domain pair-containing protein [Aphelenchoides besseyi]|nr:EF-hand domain and EF-hand domain pair-containing protein [Aphelenchoides besseyi]KAI6201030.1 EF-hand domain and EF-hand domain pair-containing protein [Aphelenchoides besseyi]
MRSFRRREAVIIDSVQKFTITQSLHEKDPHSSIAEHLLLQKRASLQELTKETYFTARELKSLYRSFKATAPTALIHRDMLRTIFAEFFRRGDVEFYSDLVFCAINTSQNGFITFAFVRTLSVLCRGGIDERIEWLYRIYDPMQNGYVSWQRLLHVMTAVDDLVEISRRRPNTLDENVLRAKDLFSKFNPDINGVIRKETFIETCRRDSNIANNIDTLQSVLIFR